MTQKIADVSLFAPEVTGDVHDLFVGSPPSRPDKSKDAQAPAFNAAETFA